MPSYKMVVLTKPIAGKDAEFNAWYDNVHIPEVLSRDAVKSAQRYKQAVHLAGSDEWGYGTIYQIETDDLGGLLKEMGEAAASGKSSRSDAVDYANTFTAIYEALGPERT